MIVLFVSGEEEGEGGGWGGVEMLGELWCIVEHEGLRYQGAWWLT